MNGDEQLPALRKETTSSEGIGERALRATWTAPRVGPVQNLDPQATTNGTSRGASESYQFDFQLPLPPLSALSTPVTIPTVPKPPTAVDADDSSQHLSMRTAVGNLYRTPAASGTKTTKEMLSTILPIVHALDLVQRMQPVVSVAVGEFAAIVRREIARDESERHVSVVLIRCASAMAEFLPLSELRMGFTPLNSDGSPIRPVVDLVAETIRDYGLAAEGYYAEEHTTSGSSSRMEDEWKRQFADFKARFQGLKDDIKAVVHTFTEVGMISYRFAQEQRAMTDRAMTERATTATEVIITDWHLRKVSTALLQSGDDAYRMAAIQPTAPDSNLQLRNRGIIAANNILAEQDVRRIFAEQDITDHIGSVTRDPLRYGGFADIHLGLLHTGLEITKVAIKFVRAHDKESLKVLRRHQFEMKVWGSIDHPNIIPLLGLYWTDRELPGLVSPWCESGDINAYVKSLRGESDNADRKCQLLQDVGRGLSYLHERGIVHGDLKGANILITDNGVAGLCDFGLSRIVAEVTGTRSRARGTIRWMAPELFDDDDAVPTPWSDMWAYGCVIVEVFSGSVPYVSMKHDEKVIIALYQRQLPERPTVIPDAMWELALRCLTVDYRCRARPSEVLERILFAL